MGKYSNLAKDILLQVGGKENVASLTHCVTRLRFGLIDETKANTETLKKMEGVVTVVKSAGQYQVVIGNHVPEVFQEVSALAGLDQSAASASAPKKKPVDAAMDFISGVFGPLLGVLCASGMIQGFLALGVFLGWISNTSGIYQLLNAVGQSLFYFFPVLLGFSCFKKLGGSPYLGALIGAAFIYPDIQGVDLDVLGMTIHNSYASTVLPIIFTSFAGVWLEKKLNAVVPTVVRSFVVPMLVMALIVPLGFCLIGTVANALSDLIAGAIMMAYNASPILAGIAMGGLWQVLVIFGIHQGLVGVAIASLMTTGMTPVFSLMMATTFAQTGIVMGIWLKTRDAQLKSVCLPAWISGIFGVTEPAIYGVTLPRMNYFVLSCLIGAAGGAVIGATGVVTRIMGGLGVFGIPSMFGQSLHDGLVALAVTSGSLVAGLLITLAMYKDKAEDIQPVEEPKAPLHNTFEISSPLQGAVLPLSEVQDPAFCEGLLGQGAVIAPEHGSVLAPVDGKVVTLFPTLHAIGVEAENGVQVLIHIGMNTVELGGKHFRAHVQQGDVVKRGQKLIDFDLEAIQKAGYSTHTPVVVTNTTDYTDVLPTLEPTARHGDALITVLA